MDQKGQSLPPSRSSRRQQRLNPLPYPNTRSGPHNPNSMIIPNIQSTEHQLRTSYVFPNLSYPSIVNTIASYQHPNLPRNHYISTPTQTHQISEHDSNPQSFHLSPSIANSSISSTRPYTAPIYISHQLYSHHPSSYSLPPPRTQQLSDNNPHTVIPPPQNIHLHDSNSSNSSELRVVIHDLQRMISQLNESITTLQADLRSTRADNEYLRTELLRSQQHNHPSSISVEPPTSIITDLLTFEHETQTKPHPPPNPPSIHTSSSTIQTPFISQSSHTSLPSNSTTSAPPIPPPNLPLPYDSSSPPSSSQHSSQTYLPSTEDTIMIPTSVVLDPHTSSKSIDPTIRILHDHDNLMREFSLLQQRQSDLH